LSKKSLAKFREKASEIFRRNRGVSMASRMKEFRSYTHGWIAYFSLDGRKTTFIDSDKWLRRHVRACYWKDWCFPRTRVSKLMSLGISRQDALGFGCSRKGEWRLSMTPGVQRALSIEYPTTAGLVCLEERWQKFAPLRRTA
jgi:RNA-directed DNA polymerase